LGSALIKTCLERGINVGAIKRPGSNLWRLGRLSQSVRWYANDEAGLSAMFAPSERYDAVIHAATDYGRDESSAARVVESNIVFPLRLLEGAHSRGVHAFINFDTFFSAHATSDSYLSAYSLCKKHFLEYAKSVTNGRLLTFFNLRLHHLYGPADGPDKFITKMLLAMLKNQSEIELTTCYQTRDFVFVEDAVNATLLLLLSIRQFPLGSFQDFEIGSGHPVTIKYLVSLMHQLTGSTSTLQFGKLPMREREILSACADIGPMKTLGWEPSISLEEGLRRTILDVSVRLKRGDEMSQPNVKC
jgi:CDP-paratose synthetase